ncbi:hypothetical protein AZE42_10163 [Rhizopogon vesiculosus]|uniref:Uncharacterized protein n=1 Tax=Rhizopogon vesiculosus TaxID=180088 RepID=A0A1J8QDH7_9AGAM|nr:hypothetical protein AZE42_10163 [Rhizopogon vesiculosus]
MSPLYCTTILGCLNAREFINKCPAFQLPASNPREGGAKYQIPLSIAVDTKQTIDNESLNGQTLQASYGLSRYLP